MNKKDEPLIQWLVFKYTLNIWILCTVVFSFFTQRHTVGTGSRCMGNVLYVFP